MFEGTEFGSGSLAGDEGVGAFVFILAASLIFKYPRSAVWLPLTFPCPCSFTWYSLARFVRHSLAIGQWLNSHEKSSFGTDGGLQESSLWRSLYTSAV